MKISRPTNVTITSITAASGSRIHPSSTGVVPNVSHAKFTVSRTACPLAQPVSTSAKAANESSSDKNSEPIASPDASLRFGCFSSAMMPAATIGSAGINQRILPIHDATV